MLSKIESMRVRFGKLATSRHDNLSMLKIDRATLLRQDDYVLKMLPQTLQIQYTGNQLILTRSISPGSSESSKEPAQQYPKMVGDFAPKITIIILAPTGLYTLACESDAALARGCQSYSSHNASLSTNPEEN